MKVGFLQRNKNEAFTLVELLVTITIFVLMSGVVLFNQTKFNSSILLTNLAYDLALTIRQAQTFGVNIKQFSLGSADVFNPYGVHIKMVNNKSTQFFLFTDVETLAIGNPDYWSEDANDDAIPDNIPESAITIYDSCQKSEGCVSRQSLKRGNYISAIKGTRGTITETITDLDVMFVRPNPEAIIRGVSGLNLYDYNSVLICLSEPEAVEHRAVEVRTTGQIEVVKTVGTRCD